MESGGRRAVIRELSEEGIRASAQKTFGEETTGYLFRSRSSRSSNHG